MGCSVGHVSFEDAYEAMFCFCNEGGGWAKTRQIQMGRKRYLKKLDRAGYDYDMVWHFFLKAFVGVSVCWFVRLDSIWALVPLVAFLKWHEEAGVKRPEGFWGSWWKPSIDTQPNDIQISSNIQGLVEGCCETIDCDPFVIIIMILLLFITITITIIIIIIIIILLIIITGTFFMEPSCQICMFVLSASSFSTASRIFWRPGTLPQDRPRAVKVIRHGEQQLLIPSLEAGWLGWLGWVDWRVELFFLWNDFDD